MKAAVFHAANRFRAESLEAAGLSRNAVLHCGSVI